MDKRYLTAFLTPPKYIIGGIKLDYFCPRHLLALQAVKSPFVTQNAKECSFKDLYIAMRICSSPDLETCMKPAKIGDRIKYWFMEGVDEIQIQCYAQFGKYLSESMCGPKLWSKSIDFENQPLPQGAETNIPDALNIVVMLMTKFGFSEKDAWNMPFSRAMWYSTVYTHQQGGDVKILTTEQEEAEKGELDALNAIEDFAKSTIEKNGKVDKNIINRISLISKQIGLKMNKKKGEDK